MSPGQRSAHAAVSVSLVLGLAVALSSSPPIHAFARWFYSARFNEIVPLVRVLTIAHALAFAAVTVFVLGGERRPKRRLRLLLGLVALAIVGELIQHAVADRTVQAADLLSNLAGVGIGCSLDTLGRARAGVGSPVRVLRTRGPVRASHAARGSFRPESPATRRRLPLRG